MELQFFSESEGWLFDEVDDAPVEILYNFVDDWLSLQVFVDDCEFVFWTEDFKGFVRVRSSSNFARFWNLLIILQLVLNTRAPIPRT